MVAEMADKSIAAAKKFLMVLIFSPFLRFSWFSYWKGVDISD